jgi:hypothetical protein
VTKPKPDLSPLLPDHATLKARRAALVDAVGPDGQGPQPATGRRRRGLRLVLGAAAALAAAGVVLIFNSGGDSTSRAFAVEPQEGGGMTIKIYSLEDAVGLERALERAGIPAQVNWLPTGMTCRDRLLTPSTAKTSMGGRTGGFEIGGRGPAMTIAVMSPQQYRERWRAYRRGDLSEGEARESIPNVSLDPGSFRPDQSVVISGSPSPYAGDPEGGFQAQFQVVEGPVEPCKPVPEPASSIGAIWLPQGGGGGAALAPSGDEARRSAIVAEASDTPAEAPPAPGQFLYTKTKVVELQGWEPDGPGTGPKTKPRRFTANLLGPEANALPVLVSTVKEVWTAPDGRKRVREALGRVAFLSSADQRRWEDAGSPPPFVYDPTEHDVRRDSSGRFVKEYPSHYWRGRHVFSNVPKLSKLPTDPEALRLAIERRPAGSSPVDPSPARSRRGGVTAERLMEILSEPITSPPLRAAALNALAEIPGIGLEHGVADVAGRRGDAITLVRERGFGRELVFDPHTSKVLAQAEMIFGPSSTGEYGVAAGTVFRGTAYLQSGIVDSTHQRPTRDHHPK